MLIKDMRKQGYICTSKSIKICNKCGNVYFTRRVKLGTTAKFNVDVGLIACSTHV